MRRRGMRGVGGFLAERVKTGSRSPMARTLRQKIQTRCIAAESDKPCFVYGHTANDLLVPICRMVLVLF